jgi:hypothetical protein
MYPADLTRVPNEKPRHRLIEVELLALDLTTCTRCVGTLTNIEAAAAAVAPALAALDARLTVSRRLLQSEAEARRHHLVSSPTVRVNGRDVAAELLESECRSCTDLCGCGEGTSCRVWRYRGAEYPEAPVGLLVEAILREAVDPVLPCPGPVSGERELPDNLRRFFRGKSAGPACCTPPEQETCCDSNQKGACCHDLSSPACGCQ